MQRQHKAQDGKELAALDGRVREGEDESVTYTTQVVLCQLGLFLASVIQLFFMVLPDMLAQTYFVRPIGLQPVQAVFHQIAVRQRRVGNVWGSMIIRRLGG